MTITNQQLAQQLGDVRQEIGKLMETSRHASQGRAVLHEKLDKVLDVIQLQAVSLAETRKDATAAALTAAQTRDRIDAFEREVTPIVSELKGKVETLEATNKTEVGPVLNTVKQVRTIAMVLVGISGTAVAAVGTVFSFFNDAARQAVLNWLGLA